MKEFVPGGKVANTKEQFPDLDDDDDQPKKKKGGKKGKKKGTVQPTMVKVEEEVDMSTPFRGKPSSFFVMETAKELPAQPDPSNPNNLEMNEE